ncbi:hypothetical protein CEXT_599421 [Caerostris extrusa]|uniref:Uncharacterized protein n=1 Tax=Caerostris extrusa TaxID=172846 RepID=A0AAV4PA43_CAEEX|nr:hypothetical protein CEXT_599421 [Caerostris extrusa]
MGDIWDDFDIMEQVSLLKMGRHLRRRRHYGTSEAWGGDKRKEFGTALSQEKESFAPPFRARTAPGHSLLLDFVVMKGFRSFVHFLNRGLLSPERDCLPCHSPERNAPEFIKSFGWNRGVYCFENVALKGFVGSLIVNCDSI